MSTQVEQSHSTSSHQIHRPLHLNMTTPLTARTLDTIRCEITKEMIAIIAQHAKNVIPCSPAPLVSANDRNAGNAGSSSNPAGVGAASNSGNAGHRHASSSGERLPSPPTTPSASALPSVPPLDLFITNLVLRSRVQAGTLICTLVYLQRLRRRLPKEARGMECTCHRIFLATLIVAGKYLNDASPKNKYWARYSTVFTVAEVNLMEKQLLFLLDFDLRIDNDNLNEAAAAFFVEPKASLPLTPTTPTFRSAQHPQHAGALESASASASAAATTSNAPEHAVARAVASTNPTNNLPAHYNHYQEQQKTASKVYPPTLGLSGSNNHRVQPVAPISDAASIAVAKEMEDTRNAAAAYQQSHGRTHSVSSMDMTTGGADMSAHAALSASHKLPSQTMRLPSQAKRQHSHESASSSSSGSLPKAGVSSSHVRDGDSGPAADMNDPKYSSNSGSNSRSSVDPLQQLSASEKLSLRPSPKKRAVSRGHHGNIPHPSPVYYCQFSGYQASSAAPSSSSSSMCSLAPLELVSYSSMRYQQQRYDPFASRGPASGSGRHHPRMAASIPSLRAPTSTSSSTSTSPYGSGQCEAAIPYFASTKGSGGGCSLGASTRKDKRTLRHQCTLPDISSRCEEYTLATAAATVSSRIPSTASTPLPAPPPVRLVSSTYEMESSPVATLVYNQSPALAHPTFGSSAGTAANNRRQGIGIASVRTKTSSARIGSSSSTHHPPVMALSSLSVNSQRSQMACEPANALLPESTSNSGSIVPFPALDDCGDDGDSGVLPSWRSHAHSDEDSQSGASSSAGGGWQLKSKILHPLSNWFRSSKQTNSSGNLSHHRRRPSNPAQSPSLCARDEASASLLSRTCNPRRFHQGKDVASARRAPFSKAPDSAMVCSSSPMYLGQQFHATPAAKPGSAAGC